MTTNTNEPVDPGQDPIRPEVPVEPQSDTTQAAELATALETEEDAVPMPDLGRSGTIDLPSSQDPAPEEEILTPESDSEQLERPHPAYGKSDHVEVARPVFSSRDAIRKLRFNEYEELTHIGLSNEEYIELAELNQEEIQRLANTTRDPRLQRYLFQVLAAGEARLDGGAFESSLERDNSRWTNLVESGANKLAIVRPKFESPAENDRLVGQAAVERMRAHLSLGSLLRVPLWHSGLWVTLKAPTEVALLELQKRIAAEKIQLGRSTSGLIFSNASIYIYNYLTDFVLLHVVEATYRYADVSELKPLIKFPDMLALVHGLLCTMYPDGYPYSQPCFINPTKCTHTIQETISLPRVAFTDTFRLTDKQRDHMVRKMAKFTKLELEAYQKEFGFNDTRTVRLSDSMTMELKLPDLESALSIGTAWIDQIVSRAERALGPSVPKETRDDYMIEQARVSSMCQYVHFVERIVMNEDDDRQLIVEDSATIADMLATATGNSEVYENYYKGIQAFIEDSTINVFGVPKVPCPACSKEDVERVMREDPQGRYPYLLPLDIVQIFFTLIDRRLTRIFQQDA